ncbi:MAG: hypothetical protein GW759_06710, partial [Cyanobacteria bacterium]|nr:hypothetical protein [Cyanobacteria bacterium CG_2015-02_32_10]
MGNIDDIFAQIENKYQEKQQDKNTVNNTINIYCQPVMNKENKDNIDSFLSEIENTKQSKKQEKKHPDLLTDIEAKFQ